MQIYSLDWNSGREKRKKAKKWISKFDFLLGKHDFFRFIFSCAARKSPGNFIYTYLRSEGPQVSDTYKNISEYFDLSSVSKQNSLEGGVSNNCMYFWTTIFHKLSVNCFKEPINFYIICNVFVILTSLLHKIFSALVIKWQNGVHLTSVLTWTQCYGLG